jgi:hypothetical protein
MATPVVSEMRPCGGATGMLRLRCACAISAVVLVCAKRNDRMSSADAVIATSAAPDRLMADPLFVELRMVARVSVEAL